MKRVYLFVAAIVSITCATWARAEVVYFNDFENTSDPLTEWSDKREVKTTPGTIEHPIDRFLGEFGLTCTSNVTLSLDNLPPHNRAKVSFDLYIIRSWDGNANPDLWTLDVNDGPLIHLIHTSFSNCHWCTGDSLRQSYPGGYPTDDYPLRTGATEVDTLGYIIGGYEADSVYRLSFDFDHTEENLILNFIGGSNQPCGDESWGLDNVQVEISRLTVAKPNGGESWMAETTEDIQWEICSDANIAEVKIEYSANNGQDWSDVNTVANTGSYEWLVPEVTLPNCLVRISDANDPNIYDTSDDVFTIFECLGPVPGDLNEDCYTNGKDLAILAAHWLLCGNPLDPACGLVAYWSFDEGSGNVAHDDSANRNDGTLIGGPNWVDGISGKALSFDGIDDHVALSSTPHTGTGEFTIFAWVKTNDDVNRQTIINYGTTDTSTNRELYLFKGYDNKLHFDLRNIPGPFSEVTINDGAWRHVGVVNSASSIQLYVDGTPSGSPQSMSPNIADGDAYIGVADIHNYRMHGIIDEVRIYNRALTAAEIEYLYNAQ